MDSFHTIVSEAQACALCKEFLPLGPRPVFSIHPKSKILIIGQAPGTKVHASGIPWNDASGNKLRRWLEWIESNSMIRKSLESCQWASAIQEGEKVEICLQGLNVLLLGISK